MEFNKHSVEYRLAEQLLKTQSALETANKILNEHGLLGVLPDKPGTTFCQAAKYHKQVRELIKSNI